MSALDDVTILFVPGLRDHVAEHWQTLLAAEIPGSITVEPLTDDRLSKNARVEALDAAMASIEGEVLIAAHSAGALMVAHWGLAPTRRIRGALLATPADVENPLPPGYPSYDDLKANGWLPIPRQPLPFPAIVAASRNDPLAQFEKVAGLARAWGAELHDAGDVGHLNPAAGYGRWDGALPLLERLAALPPTKQFADRHGPSAIYARTVSLRLPESPNSGISCHSAESPTSE